MLNDRCCTLRKYRFGLSIRMHYSLCSHTLQILSVLLLEHAFDYTILIIIIIMQDKRQQCCVEDLIIMDYLPYRGHSLSILNLI